MSTDVLELKITDGVTVIRTTDEIVTAIGSTVAGPVGPVGPAGAAASVYAVSSNPSSVTIPAATYNVAHITGQAQALSIATSGSPADGATLRISVTSSAAINLTWSSAFEASGLSLPTTTLGAGRLDIGFIYNSESSKWRCVAAI